MTTETDGFAPDQPDIPVKRRFRMTPKRWLVAGLAFVVLAGAGVGTFLLLRPSQAAGATTFSRTVEAEKGTQTLTVSLDGTLSPRKQSDVDFGVSGTVTKVYVKTGDTVAKGQKLARIDDDDLQNAVDLAEANVTTAEANLDEVYDNDGSSAAITSAKAQVRSANAALTSAKQDLENAVLRSPIAGTVASVDLEVGDTVGSSSSSGSSGGSSSASSSSSSSSSAQFVIIATATWKLEGSIGAADLGSVKAGQKVAVTTDATTDELTGTVKSVGIVATSTSDDGTATFPVVINLSGTHTDLYSGTTASAVITTGSYDDVLTVPTAAIRSEDGKTVVTKVTDGSNTTTEVEVGKVFGSYTQITSGLSEGDSVLITFTRPTSTSTASSDSGQGGGFGMGFGGIDGGGGPPAGGGGAPAGGQGGR
jgi:macrolide-specific efflux system membrane fusion protein